MGIWADVDSNFFKFIAPTSLWQILGNHRCSLKCLNGGSEGRSFVLFDYLYATAWLCGFADFALCICCIVARLQFAAIRCIAHVASSLSWFLAAWQASFLVGLACMILACCKFNFLRSLFHGARFERIRLSCAAKLICI